MLKKFQREKAKERQKTEKANQKSPLPSPLCPADAGGGSGSTDPLLSLIGSTDDHAFIQAANAVDLDIDLDSLLDVTERTSSPKTAPPFPAGADDASRTFAVPQVRPPDAEVNSQPKLHPEPIQPSSQSGSASPHRPVQLPEGLPPRLEDSIRKLTAVRRVLMCVCVCVIFMCVWSHDDVHSFLRSPRRRRESRSSSSSPRRSTWCCWSEFWNNADLSRYPRSVWSRIWL